MNIMAINLYPPTITLNANGLNAPIKRHIEAEWITKTRLLHMLSTKDSLHIERHTETKRWKKDIS